jgi:chemotaxis protein methyltransferase CheR
MRDSTFQQFSKIVYDQSGIELKSGKKNMVAARVGKRLRALSLEDEADYLKFLEKNNDEMVELINVISTNTTHFFREAAHFDLLKKVMTEWIEQGQTKFRLWCAAASSGEEPYTLAMTLRETMSQFRTRLDVKLLATDISTKCLDICNKGQYPADDIKDIPSPFGTRYFNKVANRQTPGTSSASHVDMVEVSHELKSMIHFRRLNLKDPPFPMKGPLDIVFCRNVMIYFGNSTKRPLLDDVYRLLKPGGYLIVSHTESLTGVTEQFERVGPSIYRKAEHVSS